MPNLGCFRAGNPRGVQEKLGKYGREVIDLPR